MNHLSRVEIFLKVAKKQSFVEAAQSLGMTGPAVSKQIKNLENDLGVRLLNRTTRKVTLTEEGAIYSHKARKAIEDLHEVEQQIQELKSCPVGTLKINVPMSFGKIYLIKPIAAFAKKYPQVKMEVDFDDRRVDVVGEGYDVIVRIGNLQDSSLISRKLSTCPIVLCASKSFIKKHGKPKSPKELSELPAIIFNKHGPANHWQYEDRRGNVGSVYLNQFFGANNSEMMLEACLQGLGIAALPIFAAHKHLQSGHLVEILPSFKTAPQRGIYAIFPQNRHLSTKVRLFVDWLAQYSKDLPWHHC